MICYPTKGRPPQLLLARGGGNSDADVLAQGSDGAHCGRDRSLDIGSFDGLRDVFAMLLAG